MATIKDKPVDKPGNEPGAEKRDLELEQFLPYRLAVLSNDVSRALSTIYRERFGITIPEWRVMANLGRHRAMSSNRIAELGSMDKAKVSRAVTRLVEGGLVTREVDANDNRLIVLRLSQKGRRIYRQIATLAIEWEADFLATLEEADRAALDRILTALQDRVDRMRKDD